MRLKVGENLRTAMQLEPKTYRFLYSGMKKNELNSAKGNLDLQSNIKIIFAVRSQLRQAITSIISALQSKDETSESFRLLLQILRK